MLTVAKKLEALIRLMLVGLFKGRTPDDVCNCPVKQTDDQTSKTGHLLEDTRKGSDKKVDCKKSDCCNWHSAPPVDIIIVTEKPHGRWITASKFISL